MPMMSAKLFLYTCLLALSGNAQATVIGIDFGARFLKIGVIKPGKGIEIVLNEATKRKSSSAVGFNNQEERQLGEDAKNLDPRMPMRAYLYSKLLLGKGADSAIVQDFKDKYHPYEFVAHEETGSVAIKHNANNTFLAEELVAFVLTYAKKISQNHAEVANIKDCVITVPPYWTHLEREAILNAANIVGLNVLALVHDHTAVAFKWGFDKESFFRDEPKNVVFYDMGATGLKASLATFSTTIGKKNKTTGSLHMKALSWDNTVGGRDFDHKLIEYIANKFNTEKLKGKGDCRTSPRAMGKLRKECEKIKEVLSANSEIPIGIESLFEEQDFFSKMTRAQFEEIAADLFAKVPPVLERLMKQANMSVDDVHYVEMIGGATRIAKVKQMAMDFFKRTQLDAGLNGDEAHALGAALYAAKLSTSFRLREFGITDVYPLAIGVKMGTGVVVDEETDGAETGKKKDKETLFKAMSKFPHKKLMTLSRNSDFSLTLNYQEPEMLPAGMAVGIAEYNITGVEEGLKKLESPTKKMISKPKVSLTFQLNALGLVEISKAELAAELLETYDDFVWVPANETENSTNSSSNKTLSTSAKEDPAPVGNSSNKSNATRAAAPKMVKKKVQKTRKRMHHVPLTRTRRTLGSPAPISEEEVKECIKRNDELLRQDALRAENALAKNDLESYVIDTRGKLYDTEGIEEVSTEEQRSEISNKFEAMEDWLYEEGKDLPASEYRKKLKEIQEEPAKIFFRLAELEARPKAVEQAYTALNWTRTLVASWKEERPEITETERNKTLELCTNFTDWLEPLVLEQEQRSKLEDSLFTSTEVSRKLSPIEKEVRKLIKKPKLKKPKIVNVTNATNTSNTSNSTEDANSTTSEATTEKEAPKDEL